MSESIWSAHSTPSCAVVSIALSWIFIIAWKGPKASIQIHYGSFRIRPFKYFSLYVVRSQNISFLAIIVSTCGTWIDFHHDDVHLWVAKGKCLHKIWYRSFQFLHFSQTLRHSFGILLFVEEGMRHDESKIYFLASVWCWARPGLKVKKIFFSTYSPSVS